jgi:transposase-like protein
VLVSKRRDGEAARRFFCHALSTLKVRPTEVVTRGADISPGARRAGPGRLAPRRAL